MACSCRALSIVASVWILLIYLVYANANANANDRRDGGMETAILQNATTSNEVIELAEAPFQTQRIIAGAQDVYLTHWAGFNSKDGEHYGAKATFNVYGLPTVNQNQLSGLELWVINNLSAIQTGWHVHPQFYGDNDTHFFTHWTLDYYLGTGCYNQMCKGFVVTSSELVPGAALQPLSTYNGQQFFITLKISKDLNTGDWWLYHGPDATKPVGYWPKSLFTTGLADSATQIQFGGVVSFRKGDDSPPMGSGHFATEGENKAASIQNVQLVDKNGYLYTPEYGDLSGFYDSDCYNVDFQDIKKTVYAGGPGGCKD